MKIICKSIFIGIIASAFFLISACEKKEELSPLPDKFIFSLHEKFYEDSTQIILKISSEEEYPCSNFEIIYSIQSTGSNNIIEFKGITNHGFCHTAMGSAKVSLEIADGGNNTNCQFEFHSDNDIDIFNFDILAESVVMSIVGSLSGRIAYDHNKLTRLHKNTFWGYSIKKNSEVSDERHNEMLNQLNDLGVQQIELEDGYYGFFIVNNGEFVFLNKKTSTLGNLTPLVFLYEGSLNDICNIASDFNEDLSIFIRNTLGDKCELE
jgi:hypothetical protein